MIDYIILGQGICGSWLSYYLSNEEKKFIVIDAQKPDTASNIASGVINPVTGRRMAKTWLIDELLPFTRNAYTQLENDLGVSLIRQCNVLDFHVTPEMKEVFEKRMAEEPQLLQMPADESPWPNYFRYNYGIGEIHPCWLVNMQLFIQQWRLQLVENNLLLAEEFDWQQCKVTENYVTYKHITARKIICCEGVAGISNPYFQLLPYAINKGEALIAHIPDLPQTHIYKQGISIVPWKETGMFWLGSTYEWTYSNVLPSQTFRQKAEQQLSYWLKLPFIITGHVAAERPANIERRPFAGLHPVYPAVGILNGMGTKGCSLAPYFAWQVTQYLLHNTPVNPLADVRRFSRILSR